MRERLVERSRGSLVITGAIVSKQSLEIQPDRSFTALPRETAYEEGTWYVDATAKLSCDTVKPGTVVRLVHSFRCCDVIPPSNLSCWYGYDSLSRISEAVANAIGLRQ